MFRKGPTPIRSTPSSVPHEAMIKSQQKHIDELVQKNRSLEQTHKLLKDEIAHKRELHDGEMQDVHTKFKAELKEWIDGCDSLQACHRIVHLRTTVMLENERLNVLKERSNARKERLARLQRDFRLTMFQVKETELETKNDELDEILTGVAEQHTEVVKGLKLRIAEITAELKEKAEQLDVTEKAKEAVEKEVSRMRQNEPVLNAKIATLTTKLDRATLQVETSQSAQDEMARIKTDLETANSNMKSQLDKWQTLENKGGEEAEVMRKQKIELEIKVKTLEGEMGELEQLSEKASEKQSKAVAKLRQSLEEHAQRLEEAEANYEEARKTSKRLLHELDDLKQTKGELERSNTKLSEQLDELRHKVPIGDSNVKGKHKAETQEAERPKTKQSSSVEDSGSDNAHSPLAAGSSKKPQRQTQADTEDPLTASPVPKAKRKRAATHTSASPEDRKGKKRSEVIEDSRKPKRGKKVPIEDESAGEDTVPQKKAAIKAAGTDVKGKRKPSIRAGSKLPEVDSDSEKDVPAPKKKKMRKLNAFSSAQPQTFDWGFNEDGDMLGIPRELSPVKDTGPVPQRAIFGKAANSISSAVFGKR
ncbi:hypothetical protein HETIRDRAFT_458595 [Heterobasidion irregulare TC 32-1]|uniref:Uncharacterized protein n=1 Tax=Heterobasidion irregulare (strain TC 32-1) TaxID=747525 RepID=W4KB62_HETIT|nr:uncharacterized protein HETIRDRAFT_458595 [Heterobasidion irregulare TC 32-1]ETW83038.1 hypothetical protein HETIRDRAFT_458595 [Heterobasidion irregulare TC 32-1]